MRGNIEEIEGINFKRTGQRGKGRGLAREVKGTGRELSEHDRRVSGREHSATSLPDSTSNH